MKFINRKPELEFLEKKYKSDKAELIIIYGRRRIGKTELITKFSENKKSMYFLGRLESKEDTLRRFNLLLIDKFKDTALARTPLRNWDELFEYLSKKVENRVMLVIDEFPFVVDRSPELISILQDKWDNLFKNTKLMLILCGSSIGMMEKYAINYKSPLYGRRTGQWKITKLRNKYLKDFFPKYSIKDLILVYSSIDTIPGYLVKFDPKVGVWENIKNKILSKGEFLYEEIEVLLREELRDPSNYMSILSAIAGGIVSSNEIHNKTGLDKSMLSKYLFILEKLSIVEKIHPITKSYKSKLKAKGSLYFIRDNFFDFWFRFVYLNNQFLEEGKTEAVLNTIKEDIPTYLGKKFESFILETLPDLNIFEFTKIGKWWHKDKEIDIVALNEKTKQILFCECKWKDDVNAGKILAELKEKANYVEWPNKEQKAERKEYYALFAKSFKNKGKVKEKNVFLFDLKYLLRIF